MISIITINYNKKKLTEKCIYSIYRFYRNYLENNEIEIIVVDNGSSDDSVNYLSHLIKNKTYRNIKLIQNKQNEGFGKGCNIGAAHAKGDFLLFINNDAQVNDTKILEMIGFMKANQSVGVLGGALQDSDKSSQPSTGKFYNLPNAMLLLFGFQKFGLIDKNPTKIQEVDWVKGAFLMIKKEVFDILEGFDTNIFMYTEDMELCYRARQMGYKNYFFPFTSVIHIEHGSSNRSFAIINIYKNLLYFFEKHQNLFDYLLLKCLLITKAVILIILGKLIQNKYLSDTYLKALKVVLQNK